MKKIICLFLFSIQAFSETLVDWDPYLGTMEALFGNIQSSKKSLNLRLEREEIIVMVSASEEANDQQKLIVYALGAHPENCLRSVGKINQYENYKYFLDFVQSSTYDEKTALWSLLFSSPIIPKEFILNFNFWRMKGEGEYPFHFPEGIFKGLKGSISLKDQTLSSKKRCFYQVTAKWIGPKTSIPATVIEIFVQTLSELAMQKLFKL